MAAYFSKFPTAYINGGATPNMTDAWKPLNFKAFRASFTLMAARYSAAAAENACLKATELGLGSCWSSTLPGVNDCPEVASAMKKLGLNNGYRVFASVVLGHAAENPSAAPRKYQLIRMD